MVGEARCVTHAMEDQLGALGLVLNAIVLRTTKYIDAAVAQPKGEGHELREEDIARLSPAQAPQAEPAWPLQLHRLRPGRRRPAATAGPDAGELDDGNDGYAA